MKMPEPIMPPITIIVASNNPSRRANCGWSVAAEAVVIGLIIVGRPSVAARLITFRQWIGKSGPPRRAAQQIGSLRAPEGIALQGSSSMVRLWPVGFDLVRSQVHFVRV